MRRGRRRRGGASACLLFETTGGFSPEVCELLRDLAEVVENKLTPAQYDLTTWSARTWLSYQTQRLSIKLACEVGHQLYYEGGAGAVAGAAGTQGWDGGEGDAA